MSRGAGAAPRRPFEASHWRGRCRQAGKWRGELGDVAVSLLCLLAEVEGDRFALVGWASNR